MGPGRPPYPIHTTISYLPCMSCPYIPIYPVLCIVSLAYTVSTISQITLTEIGSIIFHQLDGIRYPPRKKRRAILPDSDISGTELEIKSGPPLDTDAAVYPVVGVNIAQIEEARY